MRPNNQIDAHLGASQLRGEATHASVKDLRKTTDETVLSRKPVQMCAGSVIEDDQIRLTGSRRFELDNNFTVGPAAKRVA
jgi:hypothetical protein